MQKIKMYGFTKIIENVMNTITVRTILLLALLFILRYEKDNLNRYISPIGVLLFNERIVEF